MNTEGLLPVIALREGKRPRALIKYPLVDASFSAAAASRNRNYEGKDDFRATPTVHGGISEERRLFSRILFNDICDQVSSVFESLMKG